jgi:hypothetical protein
MQDARTTTDDGHTGLTKRELIAALALAGSLAADAQHELPAPTHARWAAACADALLAALAGGAK